MSARPPPRPDASGDDPGKSKPGKPKPGKPKPGESEPHYLGHRDRLRARFAQAGADALPDYELLELALFRAIPRRDVKPLAKALIRPLRQLCRSDQRRARATC